MNTIKNKIVALLNKYNTVKLVVGLIASVTIIYLIFSAVIMNRLKTKKKNYERITERFIKLHEQYEKSILKHQELQRQLASNNLILEKFNLELELMNKQDSLVLNSVDQDLRVITNAIDTSNIPTVISELKKVIQ